MFIKQMTNTGHPRQRWKGSSWIRVNGTGFVSGYRQNPDIKNSGSFQMTLHACSLEPDAVA
jgi:hypothetical protein